MRRICLGLRTRKDELIATTSADRSKRFLLYVFIEARSCGLKKVKRTCLYSCSFRGCSHVGGPRSGDLLKWDLDERKRCSFEELQVLVQAIHRWDGKGLSGPSKVIFDVLDDLVRDATKILVLDERIDVTEDFLDLWRETFNSWLTETTWGKSGYNNY